MLSLEGDSVWGSHLHFSELLKCHGTLSCGGSDLVNALPNLLCSGLREPSGAHACGQAMVQLSMAAEVPQRPSDLAEGVWRSPRRTPQGYAIVQGYVEVVGQGL